jgi:hypothetical protein
LLPRGLFSPPVWIILRRLQWLDCNIRTPIGAGHFANVEITWTTGKFMIVVEIWI